MDFGRGTGFWVTKPTPMQALSSRGTSLREMPIATSVKADREDY
ncbi:MAG: hypothetical protein DDT32_01891 [Syntrophomonadaceae bacterium]|nr:hypothetical protein [Bacillota bacterium]